MPTPYQQYHTQIPDRNFEADYQFFMAEDPALGPDSGTPGTVPPPAGASPPGAPAPARYGGGRAPLLPLTPDQARQAPLQRLLQFAAQEGFTVTATTGGRHNGNSLHYQGRAIDVRVRDKTESQVAQMMARARAAGFGVRDERSHPSGQALWSGAHIHLEDRR